MCKVRILLNEVDSVKEFCRLASEQPFDIDIVSGRFIIDAKSLLGLFSLDLSKPVECVVHAEDFDVRRFREAIDKFAVR